MEQVEIRDPRFWSDFNVLQGGKDGTCQMEERVGFQRIKSRALSAKMGIRIGNEEQDKLL